MMRGDEMRKDAATEARSSKLWFLPRDQWQILDTWDVAGLRGSGSHDVKADGAYVAPKFTGVELMSLPAHYPNPVFRIPVPLRLAYNKVAVALGVGERRARAFSDLAQSKIPMLSTTHAARTARSPSTAWANARAVSRDARVRDDDDERRGRRAATPARRCRPPPPRKRPPRLHARRQRVHEGGGLICTTRPAPAACACTPARTQTARRTWLRNAPLGRASAVSGSRQDPAGRRAECGVRGYRHADAVLTGRQLGEEEGT